MTIDGELCCSTTTGHLAIDGVSMHTGAWCCLDLRPLYFSAKKRGENVVIPGASGQRAYPMRKDQTDVTLRMLISGAVNVVGTPSPHGPIRGLWDNLDFLDTYVVGPPAAPTATRTATVTLPGGLVKTAAVQVVDLVRGEGTAELIRAGLVLRLPAGRLT